MAKLINITALHGYLECLEGSPVDPRLLLAACDIDYEIMVSQEGYIPYYRLVNLLEMTAKEINNPYFGLQLSQKQNLPILGILGLMMEKCPDLRSAIRESVRYFHVHTQGAAIELEEKGELAMFTYRVLENVPATQQTVDLSIGTSCNVMRLLTGRHYTPRAVYLSHAKPPGEDVHRRILGAPVTFNHELNAIVYDRKLLDLPLAGYNQSIQRLLKRNLESASREFAEDIVSDVRKLIVNMLPTGLCSIDLAARQLMVSRRRLQYLLSLKNTTFKKLLEQTRLNIARQQLQQSDISVTQLGDMLGYSDQTAFSRAFKRWFGVSPREWKNKDQSPFN